MQTQPPWPISIEERFNIIIILEGERNRQEEALLNIRERQEELQWERVELINAEEELEEQP